MVLTQHEAGGSGTLVSMAHDISTFQTSHTPADAGFTLTPLPGLSYISIWDYNSSRVAGVNGTEHSELSPGWKRYLTLLLAGMSLAGLTGNLMVIIAICLVKKLKSNTNTILSSLATADLLVCILVMPPALTQLVTGGWPLGDFTCSLYIFLDVCLCTSSILHMCAISLDRYFSIAYPLHFTRFRTKKATAIKIILVWLMAILIACPVFIHAALDKNSIYIHNTCGMNNLAFQVYGSLCAFYIPLIVMTVSYFLTTRKLNLQNNVRPSQRLRKHGVKRRSTMSSNHYTMEREDTMNALNNATVKTDKSHSYNGHLPSRESTMSLTPSGQWDKLLAQYDNCENNNNHNTLEARRKCINQRLGSAECYKPQSRDTVNTKLPIPETEEPNSNTTLLDKSDTLTHYSRQTSSSEGTVPRKPKPVSRGSLATLMAKWKSSRSFNGLMDREKKATQVLGIVFLAFVVSWSPFFIINILTAICRVECQLSAPVMDFVLWLGYSASIANPIIYTIINKYFQRAFKDMLTCKIWKSRKKQTPSIKSCITTMNGHVITVTTSLAAGGERGGAKTVFYNHRNIPTAKG